MNYLAHLYLAGNDEELLVGNFIADSVKGNKYRDFSPKIAHGILMHRATDDFSDTHSIYRRSAHRLMPKHGKFSGVITDMFYDHILAANWKDFSDRPLEQFADDAYRMLQKHQNIMPEESRIILHYMSKHNWLLSYNKLSGIQMALHGMSQRMKYYHPMDEAITELEHNGIAYEEDFFQFFPLLQDFIKKYRVE
jgi:acyl carrier protein phosphodiesterase